MINFGKEDSSDWNFSVYGFPASRASSRSSPNPAFYTVFSPLLDFSGWAGFGTWRIFVPLFWATCRLFSSFLLFWILEPFCLWTLYTLFTLVLLRHQWGLFYYCGPSHTLFYPLSLWDKRGSICLFWTGNVFLTGLVIFVPEWPNGEFVSYFIGCILLTKSLLCNVDAFTGMPYILVSSDIQSLFFWCGKSCIMTSCKCHKLHEGYFSVQGRFCVDSNSEKSNDVCRTLFS